MTDATGLVEEPVHPDVTARSSQPSSKARGELRPLSTGHSQDGRTLATDGWPSPGGSGSVGAPVRYHFAEGDDFVNILKAIMHTENGLCHGSCLALFQRCRLPIDLRLSGGPPTWNWNGRGRTASRWQLPLSFSSTSEPSDDQFIGRSAEP